MRGKENEGGKEEGDEGGAHTLIHLNPFAMTLSALPHVGQQTAMSFAPRLTSYLLVVSHVVLDQWQSGNQSNQA